MGQGRPRVDLKDMRGGLAPRENVSGCGMRSAEVQSSKKNSYGAAIPLMEGVRDVVGRKGRKNNGRVKEFASVTFFFFSLYVGDIH